MINLLEKKIKELEQAQDYECWYLVKQDTTFENLCYQVQFLKQWNESNKEKNLETYMKDEVSKLNIHENLKVSTTHRALKVATYFGLIEGVSYSTSKITDTFLEIQERCNGQFKNFNLYSDIIQRQIEKMFISSEIDEQANDLRKEFRLFQSCYYIKYY